MASSPFAKKTANGWGTNRKLRKRSRREDSGDWGRTGRAGGGADCRPVGLPGRPLRDARHGGRQAQADTGAPDHRVRGTGLFEFAEERVAQYGAVAAETGDAASGECAVADCG